MRKGSKLLLRIAGEAARRAVTVVTGGHREERALLSFPLLVLFSLPRAAELMTRTSSVVTLEVAKQGAIYHGLATLLNQPSPMMQRGERSRRSLARRVCP